MVGGSLTRAPWTPYGAGGDGVSGYEDICGGDWCGSLSCEGGELPGTLLGTAGVRKLEEEGAGDGCMIVRWLLII